MALKRQAISAGYEVLAVDIGDADISDKSSVDRLFGEFKPGHVVNAAAYNAVDAAEDDTGSAFAANSLAPAYLALASLRHGAIMVHYSTDYVFDGEKGSDYVEEDRPTPISTYGRSKLLGEQAVLEILPRSYVLRTSWVFGPGGNNFVSRLLKAAEPGKTFKFINDQWCSPTYAPDLAKVTLGLLKNGAPYGLYNAAGGAGLTPLDWATAILSRAGRDNTVTPVQMAQFATRARRPRRALLSGAKLEKLGLRIPGGPERLDDYFNGRLEV
jgi:dTDP-4-dehydrorhamnose reductase